MKINHADTIYFKKKKEDTFGSDISHAYKTDFQRDREIEHLYISCRILFV